MEQSLSLREAVTLAKRMADEQRRVDPKNGKHCTECTGSLTPTCKKHGCIDRHVNKGAGWATQPRDRNGRWTVGGAGGAAPSGQMGLFDGQPGTEKKPIPEASATHPDSLHFDQANPASGSLNGVAFESWTPPKDDAGWANVAGQKKMAEPDMDLGDGPMPKRPGSGVVIQEPDGRVWVVEPTNHFGGNARGKN